MTHLDPNDFGGEPSYSIRRETPGQVLWNRISVTGGLFATAMVSAFLLGRKR
ncbi:hypothetical protein [Amnibacterium kyonggiense]